MGVTGLSLLGSQAYRSLGGQRQGAPEVKNVQMGDSGMNVVVVVLDTMRQDHVGAYGNGWIQTPNIDALAKDSLRFTKAYPESMPTIPARAAAAAAVSLIRVYREMGAVQRTRKVVSRSIIQPAREPLATMAAPPRTKAGMAR